MKTPRIKPIVKAIFTLVTLLFIGSIGLGKMPVEPVQATHDPWFGAHTNTNQLNSPYSNGNMDVGMNCNQSYTVKLYATLNEPMSTTNTGPFSATQSLNWAARLGWSDGGGTFRVYHVGGDSTAPITNQSSTLPPGITSVTVSSTSGSVTASNNYDFNAQTVVTPPTEMATMTINFSSSFDTTNAAYSQTGSKLPITPILVVYNSSHANWPNAATVWWSSNSNWSINCKRTSAAAPDVPTLIDPDNGSSTTNNWVNSNPTFTAQVSDPNNDDVRAYFNFSQVVGNPTPPADQNGTTVNSGENSTWTPSPALADGKYDWRAKAIDATAIQSAYTGYWRVKKDTVVPTTTVCTVSRTGNAITVATLGGSDPAPGSGGTRSGIKSGKLEKSVNSGGWGTVVNHSGTTAASGEEYTTSLTASNYADTGTPGNSYAYRYYVTDGAGNVSTIRSCGSVSIPATALAELVVESISLSPSDPNANETVTATVRVRNSGQTNAGSFRVRFWSHNATAVTFSTALESGQTDQNTTLNAGAFSDRVFTFTKAAAADYTAWALVDNAATPGTVDEGDDTAANNRNSLAYTVTAEPELVINSLSLSPSAPTTNDTVSATVTIQNTGTANAGSARVRFWSHRSSAPSFSTGAESGIADQNVTLPAGTSQNLNFTFNKAVAGSYTAWAIVDNGNPGVVDETNDLASNNRFSLAYSLAAQAELVIESITIEPLAPTTGANITAHVKVRNDGTATANNFRVRFWPDLASAPNFSSGAAVGIADQYLSLPPGTYEIVDFNFTMAVVGDYSAYAIVDSPPTPGTVDEGDDTAADNRSGPTDYTVTTSANYTLTWVATSSISVIPGGTADYSINVNPDCTSGWTGNLTVTLSHLISPGHVTLSASFPSGNTATVKCDPDPDGYAAGSGPIAFHVQTTGATPRGISHTITITGIASGVADKVAPPGTLNILEGQWLKTTNGDVYSQGHISFAAPPPGTNTTSNYLLASGGNITNATSGPGLNWRVANYGGNDGILNYSQLKTKSGGANILPLTETPCSFNNNTKPLVEGVRFCGNGSGNGVVVSDAQTTSLAGVINWFQKGWGKVTSLFGKGVVTEAEASHKGNTGLTETLIFVEGDMVINNNINYTPSPTRVVMFIVSGEILIGGNVNDIDAYLFAEKGITTNSNAACVPNPNSDPACVVSSLIINGGLAIGPSALASDINFNRRVSVGSVTTTPAEHIIFDPRVLVAFAEASDNQMGEIGVNFAEISP